jgi:alpha-L-rhamnosidase
MHAAVRNHWLIIFLLSILGAALARGAMAVDGLRCEYAENPPAIDTLQPHLGWLLHSNERGEVQTAYQVQVASTLEKLDRNEPNLWDSGKVESRDSVQVPYRGQTLKSRLLCHWKVRVWDKAGEASAWSKPARWEMGLLSPADWQADWINDGKPNPPSDEAFYKDDPAPLFRKEFTLPKQAVRARLYISGLGYYEASLNGQRVGRHALDPGWTRYSERVLYSVYDVTDQLRAGRNCLGVTLGNGWFNPLPLRMWGYLNLREHLPVGRPRFIARLEAELADGSRQVITSDTTWKVSDGPIRFNNIYLGEVYDARQERPGWDRPGFDDSRWRQPRLATEPIGVLRAQTQPPIEITRTLRAKTLTEPKPGVFIFDLGQNFGGWARLSFIAPAGTKVVLRYGELTNADGTLNPMTSVCGQIKGARRNRLGQEESIGGPGAPDVAWQSDTYIASGKGVEIYTPRFTFRGFRYLEVTGLAKMTRDMISGLRLNSNVPRAGSFRCSNDRFNRIQDMCDWTFLSNLFSVQSDCPHRERFGYGGDIAVTSQALMMNYDMAAFYAKAARDWHDSALPRGGLPDTAPFVGLQYCGVAWGLADPLLQRQLYQYYGNRELIEEQYPTAQRWLDLVASTNADFIIKGGLSDHESLVPMPAPVLVTPLFAAAARTVGELAAILGRTDESAKDLTLARRIQSAYLDHFLDKTSGRIGPGTQASELFALYEGLVPAARHDAVLRYLLADVRRRQDHLTTGIYGTKFLLDVLSREGQADLAGQIVDQKTVPGWGYMLEKGATTLWEHWEGSDNTYSHNHPMFGSVSQWFYQWLGGIQPAPEAVGFDRIIIRPAFIKELRWVHSSYDSVRGRIVSRWERAGRRLKLEVQIPANAAASVYLPADKPDEVREKGRALLHSPGVRLGPTEPGQIICEVGSGDYVFELPDQKAGRADPGGGF